MRNLIVLIALSLIAMTALAGCHTSHDIRMEITLKIQQVESSVSPENATQTRSLGDDATLTGPAADFDQLVREAVMRRSQRLDELKTLKIKGVVGESNVGQLVLMTKAMIGMTAERKAEIRKLVGFENKDRIMMYRYIANQNDYSEKEKAIQPYIVAETIREERLRPGYYFQAPSDDRFYQRFLESELGQMLKDQANRGGWLQVPQGYDPNDIDASV
ncbi:MAG: DUF1318 domain-containing protein [Candidatus Sumerlaeia bacterium]